MNSWKMILAVTSFSAVALADEATLKLARELSGAGDFAGAALEYRRLALGSEREREQAVWFWAAGHAYWRAGQSGQAERMLDRAEDSDPAIAADAILLRGEAAFSRKMFDESSFFFESALRASGGDEARRDYAARRLAAAQLHRAQPQEARKALESGGLSASKGLAAVEDYETGRDRSPALGGWLGVVPGAGYAYAGEYANALRSVILNGLFIWGMVSTAEHDQWGGFAALTFFEVTWYTGSIYGGVDASRRYNRQRLDRAVKSISAGAMVTPDYEALPSLKLNYSF